MDNLKKEEWDKSYNREENFIFYPKEEIVKFLNRFVRKKTSVDAFRDLIHLSEEPKALDLGCGIGRQTILLKEFGFDAYGVDISEIAIAKAKALSKTFGYDLDNNFIQLQKLELPFEDNFLDIAISDSVLDSMEFSFAKSYINELNRTVKHLVYINIISSDSIESKSAMDQIVETNYEQGTIQSYYDEERINTLISESDFEIVQLCIAITQNVVQNIVFGTVKLGETTRSTKI
jgi:ubiquinone/menaquinone biosynthesis C-methylase UbiE